MNGCGWWRKSVPSTGIPHRPSRQDRKLLGGSRIETPCCPSREDRKLLRESRKLKKLLKFYHRNGLVLLPMVKTRGFAGLLDWNWKASQLSLPSCLPFFVLWRLFYRFNRFFCKCRQLSLIHSTNLLVSLPACVNDGFLFTLSCFIQFTHCNSNRDIF